MMGNMMSNMMGNMMGNMVGGVKKKAGDWYCSGCGDLQFRNNTQCRQCGAPKPEGAGITAGVPFGGGSVCSVHGKTRMEMNLIDDGNGGKCCKPGHECKMGG